MIRRHLLRTPLLGKPFLTQLPYTWALPRPRQLPAEGAWIEKKRRKLFPIRLRHCSPFAIVPLFRFFASMSKANHRPMRVRLFTLVKCSPEDIGDLPIG